MLQIGRQIAYTINVEGRLILVTLLLAISMINAMFAISPKNAIAASLYSCSGHCYGTNRWSGAVTEGYTDIGVRGIGGGDGFVTNEMWFSDSNSNGAEQC